MRFQPISRTVKTDDLKSVGIFKGQKNKSLLSCGNLHLPVLKLLITCCFLLYSTTFYKIIYLRAIHDVKATDLGMSTVRFKAEVDFDGRVVTRYYLEKQDIEQLLQVCFKMC